MIDTILTISADIIESASHLNAIDWAIIVAILTAILGAFSQVDFESLI